MQSRVFTNMLKSISNSRALLGYSRGGIRVAVHAGPGPAPAWYRSFYDDIEIWEVAVWGSYGKFTAGHEYGHALHEKALGGNVAAGSCPREHRLSIQSNRRCAFSEGFADFHAAVTIGMGEELPWEDLDGIIQRETLRPDGVDQLIHCYERTTENTDGLEFIPSLDSQGNVIYLYAVAVGGVGIAPSAWSRENVSRIYNWDLFRR